MNKYDDPRYEQLEENVYLDTQTNETIFVFDGDLAEAMIGVFGTDEVDSEQTGELIGPYLNKLLDDYEPFDLFSDESDLNDL